MNDIVTVFLFSKVMHCSQVFTGLRKLEQMGRIQLNIVKCFDHEEFPNKDKALILLYYNDKRFVFDLQDGYWDGMDHYLNICDYYYKRSYSKKRNLRFDLNVRNKIRPLGFNYFVTCDNNPYDYEKKYKSILKSLTGKSNLSSFTADFFEQKPNNKGNSEVRIIFFSRLYGIVQADSTKKKDEINYINNMRIALVRSLRDEYGDNFIGGLEKNSVAKKIAPDLIVPKRITEKGNYVKLLHSCDIGVGSMGLHESIGWKTAEYIASSMGIVNEAFHYSVPGDFKKGKNYLDFVTVDECIEKVRQLKDNPDKLMRMKINNRLYYEKFLAPEMLVWNALSNNIEE